MRREWILTIEDTKQCIIQSVRYPILSSDTIYASVISILAFIISWLTLAGVCIEYKHVASLTIFGSYFLFVISAVSWSLNIREMHRQLIACISVMFITTTFIWNHLGKGILSVIRGVSASAPQKTLFKAEAFTALSDMIINSAFVSLWPGFYWLSLSVILIAQFRTRLLITKGILNRLMINVYVWGMQIFVFGSLSFVVLLMSAITHLSVMVMPLITVWNCFFIFLVIVRIENGIPPAAVIKQITHVRLRK